MKRILDLGMGLCAGLVVCLCVRGLTVSADGGGAGVAPTVNGDVNGDGKINLTDAIYLLHYLFESGTAPLEIQCQQPEGPKPNFRFLNGLRCQTDNFEATLDVCGATATDRSDNLNLPSVCQPFQANTSCEARVTATTTQCGTIAVCGSFPAQAGHVYDFVLTIDGSAQPAPILQWFDQLLDAQGACPPFSSLNSPPTGTFSTACVGAGAGAEAAEGFARLDFGPR